jgi:hypothetical protein
MARETCDKLCGLAYKMPERRTTECRMRVREARVDVTRLAYKQMTPLVATLAERIARLNATMSTLSVEFGVLGVARRSYQRAHASIEVTVESDTAGSR